MKIIFYIKVFQEGCLKR